MKAKHSPKEMWFHCWSSIGSTCHSDWTPPGTKKMQGVHRMAPSAAQRWRPSLPGCWNTMVTLGSMGITTTFWDTWGTYVPWLSSPIQNLPTLINIQLWPLYFYSSVAFTKQLKQKIGGRCWPSSTCQKKCNRTIVFQNGHGSKLGTNIEIWYIEAQN